MSKPILCPKQQPNGYNYKNCFTAYVGGLLPIQFYTDMSEEGFTKAVNGEYTVEEIRHYEETGQFDKPP